MQAARAPTGDPKPLFDFAQRQNAAIRRQQAAVKFDHDRLAGSGRQTGSGSIGSFMANAVARLKFARIGFDNQTPRKINRLSHIRQPAVHNAG